MSLSEGTYIKTSPPSYGSLATAVSVEDEDNQEPVAAAERCLTFHDLVYEVSVRCGRRRKVILNSCSGIMRPGLNALMGPTGSGKTTLLDVLADRKGKNAVSGTVLINGRRRPKNFKCAAGYVVQDDLIMGALSVRENLQFSAALRLPSRMTRQQRRERVERVIEELGLQSCANTKVGTEFLRGVSGGERKRTSIGMELIIQPQVLFLDEPTTGLDAYTAVSVVQLLKELSRTEDKRVIILSIHQPRYSIFRLFNSLTLLSHGEVVYHGAAQHALAYFDALGFKCSEHENPADYFLDMLTYCEKRSLAGQLEGEVVEDTDPQSRLVGREDQEDPLSFGKAIDMVDSYKRADMYQETRQQLQRTMDQLHERERRGERSLPAATYARNILWQTMVVTLRSAVGLLRNPLSFYLQVAIMVLFGFIVGLVYFQLDKKKETESTLPNVINDRIGVFFFMVMNQVFSNMSAVDLFIRQKALFIHENSGGFYRVSVFFFSQILTDLIAKRIAPVVLYSIITYFMVGLQLVVDKFFIFMLTMFMTSTTAASVTYAYSSVAPVTAVGTLLSALTFVISMLFGGFFIALDSLPTWLQWLKYLSLFKYSIEAFTINEIAGQQYFANDNSSGPCEPSVCVDGTDVLKGRGFETASIWIWYDQIALLGISLFFLTICFINLQLIKKHK